jgi:hypothetical protein
VITYLAEAALGPSDSTAPYPDNQLAPQSEFREWPEGYRLLRTCMYCKKVFRLPGAAVSCEHRHRRGGNTSPGAPP